MKVFVIVAVFMLGACGFTPEGQAVRLAVKQYSAQAADTELENLEWAICNALTVGAFKRKYGSSQTKATAWRTLCEGASESPVEDKK